MRHIQSAVVAVLGVLLLTSNVAAAECNYDRSEFDAHAERAEATLKELERLADSILERGVLTDEDGFRNDSLMLAYGDTMYQTYQIAYSAADAASKSQGREGDGRLLTDFELKATNHESRTVALALKWEKIHAAVVQGEIREASVLPQKGGSAIDELTQEGQKKLTYNGGALRPEFLAMLQRGEQEQNSFGGKCKSAVQAVGNLLVPQAEAALIAKCVPPCAAKNWAACAICIFNSGAAAINAYNDFRSCWDGAGTCSWRRPWACIKKAWCLAQFIARLA